MKKLYTLLLSLGVAAAAMALPQANAKYGTLGQESLTDFAQKRIMTLDGSRIQSHLQSHQAASSAMKAPMREAAEDFITNPQGESQNYAVDATGFQYIWGDIMLISDRYAGNIVWGEGNKVYIRDIISSMQAGVYVEGVYEDGKITVTLPQVCYYEDWDGEVFPFYASKMELFTEQEGQTIYFGYSNVADDENVVVYNVNEDGTITLDMNDIDELDGDEPPHYIIGLCMDPTPGEDTWEGFGDAFQDYSIFDEVAVTLPEGVETEEWAAVFTSGTGTADVAIDGDDLYLGNFFELIDGFYIKGAIQGDKAVFDFPQFVGAFYGYYMYITAFEWDSDEWIECEPLSQLEMAYDAEAKKLSVDNELIDIVLCIDPEDSDSGVDFLDNPTFLYQTADDLNAAPQKPYVAYFDDYDYRDFLDAYEGYIEWIIPNVNVNGFVLNTEDMYYHFLVNGEVMTFTTDEYPEFDDDYTDIPYDYSDGWDLQVLDESHYFSFRLEEYETFGLQSFYVASNGEVYASELATYYPPSSVNSVANKAVKTVEFYNMQGLKVTNPSAGMYIMRTTLEDGSVVIRKIAK